MVIRDLMDLLCPRNEYTAEAIFYAQRPEMQGGGVSFGFDYVDPKSKTWRTFIGNVGIEAGETAISTNERVPFKSGESMVQLPDGSFHLVKEIITDLSTVSKQALRLWRNPVGAKKIIRLIQVDEPWAV